MTNDAKISGEERAQRLLIAALDACSSGRKTASESLAKEARDQLRALWKSRAELQAAVAAEREACAGLAINKANRVQGYNDDMELAYRRIAAKIRARTDTDAQASLETVKREARKEALAEAWSISDQNGDVKTATDLQKIITEDQSDEQQ